MGLPRSLAPETKNPCPALCLAVAGERPKLAGRLPPRLTLAQITNTDMTHARTEPDTQRAQAHSHTQTTPINGHNAPHGLHRGAETKPFRLLSCAALALRWRCAA